MLTSMGATAELLFAVPQGALFQPWAVIGGHLLSAFVCVTVQQLVPDQIGKLVERASGRKRRRQPKCE